MTAAQVEKTTRVVSDIEAESCPCCGGAEWCRDGKSGGDLVWNWWRGECVICKTTVERFRIGDDINGIAVVEEVTPSNLGLRLRGKS